MKIVIVSEIEWGFLRQRHHFIAEEFAKYGELVFVERVVSRRLDLKRIFLLLLSAFKGRFFVKDVERDRPSFRFIRSLYLADSGWFAAAFNWFWYRVYLQSVVQNAVIYSFTPMISKFPGAKFVCFDVIHNWWEMGWNRDEIGSRLAQMLDTADMVICDSPPVSKKYLMDWQSKGLKLVLPGLTRAWYEATKLARSGLESKTRLPELVFFGNLRGNSDLALIETLSKISRLKVIGIVQEDCVGSVIDCEVIGELSHEKLLEELHGCDGVVLPYKSEAFSNFISPAKYFECLALRVPLISNSKLTHMPLWSEVVVEVNNNFDIDSLRAELQKTLIKIWNSEEIINNILTENIWENKAENIVKDILRHLSVD